MIHAGYIYFAWVCWTLINFDEINHKKLSNRSKDFILIRLTFSCSKGVKRTILQHWHGFNYSFIQIVIGWHFDFPVLFIYTCDIWINANKARQIITKLCGALILLSRNSEVINSKTFAKAKRISYLDYLTVWSVHIVLSKHRNSVMVFLINKTFACMSLDLIHFQ